MDIEKQLKILCANLGIPMSELAKRFGDSPQNFKGKLNRGTLKVSDMYKIAEVTGTEYINYFQLSNGDKI